MLKFNPFRSMTIQGVLLGAGAYLWAHFDPTGLSSTGQAIVGALAAVWSALGLRNAIAKNGQGV